MSGIPRGWYPVRATDSVSDATADTTYDHQSERLFFVRRYTGLVAVLATSATQAFIEARDWTPTRQDIRDRKIYERIQHIREHGISRMMEQANA